MGEVQEEGGAEFAGPNGRAGGQGKEEVGGLGEVAIFIVFVKIKIVIIGAVLYTPGLI